MKRINRTNRNKRIYGLHQQGYSNSAIGRAYGLSHVQVGNILKALEGKLLTNCTLCGFPDFKLNTVQWDYGTWLLCDSCLAIYNEKRGGQV